MPEELVTIATYPTPAEAAVARLALEAEGIAAFVTNDHLVGMTWILGNALGHVKVLVPASHAEQSLKTPETRYDDWPDRERPSWKCADCGEVIDAEYEECWPFPMRHPLLGLALSFYSVALLLALEVTNAPLSQRGKRCLVGAWVFNALAGLGIGLVSGLFAML